MGKLLENNLVYRFVLEYVHPQVALGDLAEEIDDLYRQRLVQTELLVDLRLQFGAGAGSQNSLDRVAGNQVDHGIQHRYRDHHDQNTENQPFAYIEPHVIFSVA